MYDYGFYPHFTPKIYSSYSQSQSKFVNRNVSNYNRTHLNQTSKLQKNLINKNSKNNSRKTSFNHKKEYSSTFKTEKNNNLLKQQQVHNSSFIDNNAEILFEFFGIKLHYDDILLICLIFFLYNEGIKDEFLFIALILLLLS